MSEPELPDIDQEQALSDLLASVALEEVALAHFMNAEAEKVQAIAGMIEDGELSSEEAIEQQEAIAKVMRTPIKKQILLQFKLEDILDFKEEAEFDNC